MTEDVSASERAYQRVKGDILSGVIQIGLIDIRALGDQLRMSVTPVREALARLSAERLVRLAPHQGYVVAMPSARRPKSRIICGVAWGDMKVEKTPIFMMALLVSLAS